MNILFYLYFLIEAELNRIDDADPMHLTKQPPGGGVKNFSSGLFYIKRPNNRNKHIHNLA